jgi:ubiquitin carboxyl-terminal hydrolase 5/13
VVRPRVPLSACLEAFAAPETIQDFYSSAIKGKTTAVKTARMGTFPPYLVLHMRKFVMDRGWVPRKLDVFVDVPEHLDLAALKATGRTDDEEELPEDNGLGAQCPQNVCNFL